MIVALVAAVQVLGAASSQPRSVTSPERVADLVFYNAKILTMDPVRAEASAIAINGETILAVGSFPDVKSLIDSKTRLHDLGGRTIMPGINDTHIHVRDLGFEERTGVNLLERARSIADVQKLLRERLAQLQRERRLDRWRYPTTGETGPWLFGGSWTQDRLIEKRMANRRELDQVSREVPISLTRLYNGIAVNTKVFELLGIDIDDPRTHPDWFRMDPPDFEAGDIIVRDPKTGLPNGVFLGTKAPRLVSRAEPSQTFGQRLESLVEGLKVLSSLGVTSIVEAGSQMGRVTKLYQAAYDAGQLPVRVTVYDGWYRSGDPQGLGDPGQIEARMAALGFHNLGNEWFRVRGIKSSADGGIGSRSAALSEPFLPFEGDPLGAKNYGVLRDPDFKLRLRQFQILAENGWELHTHACGDAAMRQTMDAYKVLMDAIRAKKPAADLRWSIIHAYLPNEPRTSVLKDMADYKIIANVNPAFLYYQGDSFLRNIGAERMTRHTHDPWVGLHAIMTRRDQITSEVFNSAERLTLTQALPIFTINGAYLTYNEDILGSLAPGKRADLVLLDTDLARTDPEAIRDVASKVLLTMVGGQVKYQKTGFTLRQSLRPD
jgi:predicted amidohydrolase YtcJ